jgi:hypothetical protein
MSAGRSLDDKLERQLAGAVIPEDEVDLFVDEEDIDGWLGDVPSPTDGSLDGSVVMAPDPAARGGAGRSYKASYCRSKTRDFPFVY